MGTRAFSHESIFMPDGRAESEESIQAMSKDNLVGKVKTLQQQLARNIKFGQPSQMTGSVKAPGEASASWEADVLLSNPVEAAMPPDVVLPENHHNKGTPVKVSSRPKRHHSPSGTIETVNLDAIPLAASCLDNSAAKHKLSVRPKNQRISKKHRLSKEVQSVLEAEFGQEILESQGSEDKMTQDDGYYRPERLIQHGEVQEQKTEGKLKQDQRINLEARKKEQMVEGKFKSPVEHKRLQEFEACQEEQVGKKPKLQEEQAEEKKEQDHQVEGLKKQEKQGRHEEEQAQIQKKSQDLEEQQQRDEEQQQRDEEQAQRELEAQGQQEEAKRQTEVEVQRVQQKEQKRQLDLELQRQQKEEQKKQHDLELQRQWEEEQKRQCDLELQRWWEEEQKRQRELKLQSQREEEQKRKREVELQHELELQRQQEEEQRRQHDLELQRQWGEEQKRQCELELQKQWGEEQKRQHDLELQKQRKEEQKRQHDLKLQKQQEEEQKIQHELKLQRQWKEEQKRERDVELQRQREEEQKRQRELELQRQREEEQKRERELELQRQREEEQKRQHELKLQRQREEEQKSQHELELQRQWEEEQKRERDVELQRQREEEQKRQHELELQRQREEEQKRQHELELQRQQEEEQKRQRELELQRQREEEQKRQRDLELQRQQEEEQKRQRDLELQRQQEEEQKTEREEEQKRQYELEIQRQWQEEQKQNEQEEHRHQNCVTQNQQKVKEPKEEKRHQETEQKDNLIEQGWRVEKKEAEKQKTQEEKISHPYLEQQKMKELKTGQTEESEKLSEFNQQQEQKREMGQRKKEESSRNLDDRNKLQKKGTAMKLMGQEEEQQNLNEKLSSTHEQKQQKSAKWAGSISEDGKVAPAEIGHLWAEKKVQQEEFMQRAEGAQSERQKTLCLVDQRSLEKSKEENQSHQLPTDPSEDEHLETVEKELQRKEEPEQQPRTQPGKEQKEEGSLRVHQAMNVEVEEQERVLGEELRWQEVDAGQAMSRGFTFQVSSGEKEIIFPKVNLCPVTPIREAPLPSATKECKDPESSRGSSGSLPTSLCVPHTAILVTGTQLCGTAVNLSQIKDPACKSLLGLTEEKKAMDESAQKLVDGRPNSAKVKHVQESVDNQAVLDEWASIRSKILKGAENDKFNEKDNGSLNRHSDDWTTKGRGSSHGNLRKTLSANAKFSITPAWQKFSEVSKTNSAAENKTAPETENAAGSPSTPHSDNEAAQTESPNGDASKNVGTSPGKTRGRQEVAGNTEGCKFAKDLPSFLVPSLPYSPKKELSLSDASSTMEAQQSVGSKKLDRASPGGEENASPFGVKLRRTNYSLRFHYDQQAEQKKKKRYSAGDSFDGLPTPLVTPGHEQGAETSFSKDNKSPSQDRKDARLNSDNTALTIISRSYTIAAPVSSPAGPRSAPGQEKSVVSKSPLPPKPALAPKPVSQTPPPSPLSKPRRSHVADSVGKKASKVELDTSWRKREEKGAPPPPSHRKTEEEESREKKSFFPSITMPWREKAEKKPEPLKRERPVLQSRHSIDGSKVMEKGETVQPLWITLALQKQKGFREQQATREERRQAREAKQAEKLAKENASISNQADNKSNNMSRPNMPQRSIAPEEGKKIETATSRFERREQLKKSTTLPSSVTVEITDSLSSSPLAKEVTKRFSTPDANQISTEPAWLALAKRKAKAWSDCPQIIK